MDLAIGVDVGATKIATALATRDGRTLAARHTLTLAKQGVPATLERIAGEINAMIATANTLEGARLLGVGVGTPGQVLAEQGVVCGAVNLGWERVALVDELRARMHGGDGTLPVWIEKDANASALGEAYYGAARGCSDFVYLGVGSGLGGGVLTGGRLVTGANANAAEVGHLSLDPVNGMLCVCGLRGCAETVASGPGLINAYKRISGMEAAAADILAAALAGQAQALAALDEAGRALGIVAAACVALLNPACLVIGGGLGVAAYEFFEKRVRLELAARTLPPSHRNLKFAASELQSPAMGAACLVWYAG